MTDTNLGPDMETALSHVLLGGVLASFVLIMSGLVSAYALGDTAALGPPIVSGNFLVFASQQISLLTSGSVAPRTLVTLGILVLMLTPYVRVLSSVVLFGLRERDLKFTLITLFVLCILTAGLALA
jgi:uncharacterized membrane protein